MDAWGIIIISAILIFFLSKFLFKNGNTKFWKWARQNPNIAYDNFVKSDCWVVVHPDENVNLDNSYTGPFRLPVPILGNRIVKLYAKSDCLESSQEEILKKYGLS